MEAFVVKISASLLIIVLITSHNVAEKLSMESKIGKGSGTNGARNNTLKEDCKQDVTGFRRVFQYVYNNPQLPCYKQFFVGEQPPEGLRHQGNNQIRYICQPARPNQQPHNTYYATMFDEYYGIAVFTAYTLIQAKATDFPGHQSRVNWCPTPGITRQGSDDLYWDEWPYQKGHLAPAHTFSNDRNRYVSTYTYTNAVPQCQAFNGGRWKAAENRIRNYAVNDCASGTLYLLTGTSFVRIQPGRYFHFQIQHLDGNTPIAIPNSMWTAGCCVHVHNTKGFAVIGNNVQDEASRLTLEVTVEDLQHILKADVTHLKIGGPNVNLFPGNPACSNPDNNAKLGFH